MLYAMFGESRILATKGGDGICELCGAELVAKCGTRIVHHWAHKGRRNCDPWWENETDWHRRWKLLFPENCRETCHVDVTGEIHRADIKTPTGIVIEVQHSPMSDKERISRESFYKNLIWVLDGSTFVKNFRFHHFLPAPTSILAQDVVFWKAQKEYDGVNSGLFWRRSERNEGDTLVQVHGFPEIEQQVKVGWQGHRQYSWVYPLRTWLNASCPVYLDFGDELLHRLEDYGEYKLECIRTISKAKFMHDVMVETQNTAIATRFYTIDESS